MAFLFPAAICSRCHNRCRLTPRVSRNTRRQSAQSDLGSTIPLYRWCAEHLTCVPIFVQPLRQTP